MCVADLKGKTLINIEINNDQDEILFTTACGIKYKMYHDQDCCEYVSIDDICGDLQDIIGSEILVAEEVCDSTSGCRDVDYPDDSYEWTFYKLDTQKGGVTIKWYGASNGYYSESVEFTQVKES